MELTGIRGKSSWTLEKLQPYTIYQFCVYAVNNAGTSKLSEVAEIRTDEKGECFVLLHPVISEHWEICISFPFAKEMNVWAVLG